MRWKNGSVYWKKKRFAKTTVESIFFGVQPTNTYPMWLHNNLKLYRASKHNPDSKIMIKMFMEGHLELFSMKNRWNFSKAVYKQMKEEIEEIDKDKKKS